MNADLQALGAAGVVLGLGMLWMYVRDQRNSKYSAAEFLRALRDHDLGVKTWTGFSE